MSDDTPLRQALSALGIAWEAEPTAAPLTAFEAVRLLVHRPVNYLAMTTAVYRRLHWAATLGSVRHLPTRTRRRLLARIRRDMKSKRG